MHSQEFTKFNLVHCGVFVVVLPSHSHNDPPQMIHTSYPHKWSMYKSKEHSVKNECKFTELCGCGKQFSQNAFC